MKLYNIGFYHFAGHIQTHKSDNHVTNIIDQIEINCRPVEPFNNCN